MSFLGRESLAQRDLGRADKGNDGLRQSRQSLRQSRHRFRPLKLILIRFRRRFHRNLLKPEPETVRDLFKVFDRPRRAAVVREHVGVLLRGFLGSSPVFAVSLCDSLEKKLIKRSSSRTALWNEPIIMGGTSACLTHDDSSISDVEQSALPPFQIIGTTAACKKRSRRGILVFTTPQNKTKDMDGDPIIIDAYMMKHFKMPARLYIAWYRLCGTRGTFSGRQKFV